MSTFEPWEKFPDLTLERLTAVANLVVEVRQGVLQDLKPDKGDGPWSFGCLSYERMCHAIKKATGEYGWLSILQESRSLEFSFAIGSVPLRFYRGLPDDPPPNYQFKSYGELQHIQFRLELSGLPPIDSVLRLAIETKGDGTASVITLVEMDAEGHPTATFEIPLDNEVGNVVPIQTPPVDLPPAVAEPLRKHSEQERKRKDNGISSIS